MTQTGAGYSLSSHKVPTPHCFFFSFLFRPINFHINLGTSGGSSLCCLTWAAILLWYLVITFVTDHYHVECFHNSFFYLTITGCCHPVVEQEPESRSFLLLCVNHSAWPQEHILLSLQNVTYTECLVSCITYFENWPNKYFQIENLNAFHLYLHDAEFQSSARLILSGNWQWQSAECRKMSFKKLVPFLPNGHEDVLLDDLTPKLWESCWGQR